MNRGELVEAVAEMSGVSREGARRCLDALFGSRQQAGVLVRALRRGEKVQLVGFGTFEARHRPARHGYNPRSGERIRIAARVSVVYRPSTTLQVLLQAADDSAAPGGRAGAEPAQPGTPGDGRR